MSQDIFTSTSGCHDHPPPYTLLPSAIAGESASPSSRFSGQLLGLRGQLRRERAARSSAQDRLDDLLLSLLVPHVEALLESIAAISPVPSLVEATLVPSDAVGGSWRLSDTEGNQNGQFIKLIRVDRHSKMPGDKRYLPDRTNSAILDTTGQEQQFNDERGHLKDESDNGTQTGSNADIWWWSDEELARRLAGHLQPAPETAEGGSFERQTSYAEAEPSKQIGKKAGRWSFFSKESPRPMAQSPKPMHLPSHGTTPSPAPSDGVSMEVNAEEATFRRQNEMGIWESKTGWGLVVRVCIRI
ncbi:hypothetical protein E4U19_005631 [Claviceps sp. Clav32 group G5]|nr:hypothetical protein E4U19_005631 [Claviceps sp. Clav32 group G5]KAG6049467.1 hypothetical protein E4U39_006070 [Claviceps sp. Clav50 group G5]